MENVKRKKALMALKKLNLPEGEGVLSDDLPERIGSLEKITIRLDRDILEHFRAEAKDKSGGRGYQKLINDKLRIIIGGEQKNPVLELSKLVAKLNLTIKKLELSKKKSHQSKNAKTKKTTRLIAKSHTRMAAKKKV